jgi:hypothetical protein
MAACRLPPARPVGHGVTAVAAVSGVPWRGRLCLPW